MVKSAENKQAEMSGTPVAAQIKKSCRQGRCMGGISGSDLWIMA